MVLCPKARESRSLPGLPSAKNLFHEELKKSRRRIYAGWSSPVARQAHNLKVVGSNPAPATTFTERHSVADKAAPTRAAFLLSGVVD
jgi:hypothetical protein